MEANTTLQTAFSVESNKSEIRSLEHVVFRLSLTIENYTTPRSLAQYHIMQSLFGTHFDQADINGILEHNGARRGDVSISLTSPSGTESILLPHREKDFVNTGTLSWSFMSVQHWGETPVGQWNIAVNFNSSEGYIRISGLNVMLYGMSRSSVTSVSEYCSSECKGKCAEDGPNYCDSCMHYRDLQSLTCVTSCNLTGGTSYEVRGGYCMPHPTHTSTTLLATTSTVSIPPHNSATQRPIIFQTDTLHINPIWQSHQQTYTNTHSSTYTNLNNFAASLTELPLPKLSTDGAAASIQSTTLRQTHAVMMTSPLLLPTQTLVSVSKRPSPTSRTLRPTNTIRTTVVVSSTDGEINCVACAAIPPLISSTNFLVMFCVAITSCFSV